MTDSVEQSKENGGRHSGPTVIKGSEEQYKLNSRELSNEKGVPAGISGSVSKPSGQPVKDSVERSRENG
jgi:hypothetical protein